MDATVIGALRRFLPVFLAASPPLDKVRRRTAWAIANCRTPAMGGSVHECICGCGERAFVFHSCNNRSCPQCGRADTATWVARELSKRVGAPYFMVTFTLPQQLRAIFFTVLAKACYDVFFAAAAAALSGQLARPKYLGAQISGFTAVLHTWTRQMMFHPHIHFIVPGAGISAFGKVVTLKNGKYLVYQPALCAAFREEFRKLLAPLLVDLPAVDPAVWSMDWGVHIEQFGDGGAAVRYLGRYVCRAVISDPRIATTDTNSVTIRYKDRARGNFAREEKMAGTEFVRRFLTHVLPSGMRAVRRYGFCHPASRAKRERVAFHTGRALFLVAPAPPPRRPVRCPRCGASMRIVLRVHPPWSQRGPPGEGRKCS